jgi:hypothetical protein
MRRGALCCWAVLFWGCGLALGQAPAVVAARPAELADDDDAHSEAPARPARVWARAEYLLWWIRDSHFPVLLTRGDPLDPRPGALGMPGTIPLFGGDVHNQVRSGGRFALGLWLDDYQETGAEASYLFLGERTVGTRAGGPGGVGSPVIGRPFFDVLANREDSSLVAYPGLIGGTAVISSSSFLQGVEANATTKAWCGEGWRLDVLAGFRYLQLNEDLGITEDTLVSLTSPAFAGNAIHVADQFTARNAFYGAQIGSRFQFRHGGWDVEVLGKVGLGDSHQSVDIHGLTANTPAGQPVLLAPGGLLAAVSNSGHFQRDTFAVASETGVNLGYQINKYVRVYTGYTILYWSDVARPGDQIDRGVNVNGVPASRTFGAADGPARPTFAFHGSTFWAQGVNFGLEFRY